MIIVDIHCTKTATAFGVRNVEGTLNFMDKQEL